MSDITVEVVLNKFPGMTDRIMLAVNQGMRHQHLATRRDVVMNIRKWKAIDTGTMIGSVRSRMTGTHEAEVKVGARSDEGYPYPAAVNYGTVHMDPRPFFTEAVEKARVEFGPRVQKYVERAI